jgi:hypothetical protein
MGLPLIGLAFPVEIWLGATSDGVRFFCRPGRFLLCQRLRYNPTDRVVENGL